MGLCDLINGDEQPIEHSVRPHYCDLCDGSGEIDNEDEYDGESCPKMACPKCGGEGEL